MKDKMFDNKTILITGGTGSFGHAVLDRFLGTGVREIRVFSRDEKKQDDMRKHYRNDKVQFHVGDVRDITSIRNAIYGVDYIFHAAALKQVPSCEFFPLEAVKTNILGTDNIIAAAIEAGVQKVICLSTDKAAYPINAMGISKAMMEKVALANARTTKTTLITCTRYGNVMCSRGSVIPLFIEQLKSQQPVTITNPHMTRFLMSLDEAVGLVEYAFQNARPGDLFIQKSPACTIADLAKAVIELFDPLAQVRQIGSRHGEKLYETLATSEEKACALGEGNYFRIPVDKRDLNYEKFMEIGSPDIDLFEPYTSHNTDQLSVAQIKEKLLGIDYVQNELKGWKA